MNEIRNIDDDMKELWDRCTNVADSTRTKITKVVAPIIEPIEKKTARVEKKLTSLGKIFRDLFRKGSGDIDEFILK